MQSILANSVRNILLSKIFEEKRENDKKENKVLINSQNSEEIESKYKDASLSSKILLIECNSMLESSTGSINIEYVNKKIDSFNDSYVDSERQILKSYEYLKKLSKKHETVTLKFNKNKQNSNSNLKSINNISVYTSSNYSFSDVDSNSNKSKTLSVKSNSVYTPFSFGSNSEKEELNLNYDNNNNNDFKTPINFNYYFSKFKSNRNVYLKDLMHSEKASKSKFCNSSLNRYRNDNDIDNSINFDLNKNFSDNFSECSIEN